MKFTWGHGIAIFLILFVGIFVYLVMLSTTKSFDLQTENYYEQEINYQQMIEKRKNTLLDSLDVFVAREGQTISITYPEFFVGKEVSGELLFYRPSNKDLDFTTDISFDESLNQFVKTVRLQPGLYTLKFDFSCDDKPYYIEKDFFY